MTVRMLAGVCCVLTMTACNTSAPAPADPLPEQPTFARDIAPIVFAHCTPCHRPDQPVPFTLIEYEDVRSRATRIVKATAARRMPPWLPADAAWTFVHERRLSERQIALIDRWAATGAVEGDVANLPERPAWSTGWSLGKPDLVVRMPRPYAQAPVDADTFRNFTIPVDLSSDRFVRALEFKSSNPRAVHHAVIAIDTTSASRLRDGSDGAPGYDGMMAPSAQSPDGHFLGWTPGRGPIEMPEGMTWRLTRGSDLVVQLHLPSHHAQQDMQVEIGLYFSAQPPTHVPVMLRLGSRTIDIPAGSSDYSIEDTFVLPSDVDLLSVYPHAHYLARQMEGRAVLPDGTVRTLIRIPDWDFHWQQEYRLTAPLKLPRGTRLSMRFTYDNSGRGHHSHQTSPRRVLYGPNSTDEMGDLWLQVLPTSEQDRAVLSRLLTEREHHANVAGGEALVRVAPDDAGYREFLGSSYLHLGRANEAVLHLQKAVQLAPDRAGVRSEFGVALLAQGRTDEALRQLQDAVTREPGDDRLHFNLANAFAMTDRVPEAIRELRTAVAINPHFAEAHNNLAALLSSTQQLQAALTHFERAVAAKPDYADAQSGLGALLAHLGRTGEARQHLDLAVRLDPTHAGAREALRRLQ